MTAKNSRRIALALYTLMYVIVVIIAFSCIDSLRVDYATSPIPTAVGMALAIVVGVWITDKHILPPLESETEY